MPVPPTNCISVACTPLLPAAGNADVTTSSAAASQQLPPTPDWSHRMPAATSSAPEAQPARLSAMSPLHEAEAEGALDDGVTGRMNRVKAYMRAQKGSLLKKFQIKDKSMGGAAAAGAVGTVGEAEAAQGEGLEQWGMSPGR
jgi:hypothetical protein